MKSAYLLLATFLALIFAPLTKAETGFFWSASTGAIDILGPIENTASFARAINDSGQVTGEAPFKNADGTMSYHPFIWTLDEGMVDLGLPTGTVRAEAHAINAVGDVAGRAFTADNNVRPFVWSPGKGFRFLVSSKHADPYLSCSAINNFDEVVGYDYDPTSVATHVLYWSPALSEMRFLGGFPANYQSFSYNGINNLHHIAGTMGPILGSDWHAFIWTKLTGAVDINFGGRQTEGWAINDNDEVVGVGDFGTPDIRGFYWSRAAGMVPVQTLYGRESYCTSINLNSTFVGYEYDADTHSHAVIWYSTDLPMDLAVAPDSHSFALGINNQTHVVGYYLK